MSSYCYYYLSGYPGESFSSPNAFLLQQCSGSSGSGVASTDWTFGDIKDSFPVKEGEYYFRFRQSDGGGGFNWIDVRQDDYNAKVPKFQGCVFAKVLRLDKLPRLTPTKMRLNAKKARQKQQRNTSPPPQQQQHHQQQQQQQQQRSPQQHNPPPQKWADEVVQKTEASPPPPRAPSPPPVPLSRVEKLQLEYKKKQEKQEKVWDDVDQRWVVVGDKRDRSRSPKRETTPITADLLGGTPPKQPNTTSAPPAQNAATNSKTLGVSLSASNAVGKSANVAAAVHARVQEMEDAQEKAVKELRDREKQKVKDAEEMDEVRARLEPKIKEWSEEYGKKRQLRALLSSLDKVLWPESSWKPINLGDILDSKKARRAYLKASLKVHPDKTKNLLPDQKFIATGVFDALSQANAEFEAKGGM
ncbi:hypothetical protein TrLO_g9203 [Triparma laevis f. longispina]|uniref:J domain-containing protein n=1 Tax=Triparma laevis f. longispina TaxID=1714387 RepID=A0A9W7KVH2_9STRA|nr:hypothetical protein TrLO_g9203 [Triparma laevis f. longispina]